jgi:hypothetical protein
MTSKGKYAVSTSVSPEKTLAEIMALLRKYGAESLTYGETAGKIGLVFQIKGRWIRFVMPLPDKSEATVVKANQYSNRAGAFSQAKYDQMVRSRWRALLLTIRAKLESVESGIETFEQAFMAQILLPDGQTVSEWASPQIEAAYSNGMMPPMLPMGAKGD